MPSSHLILRFPLLLLASIFPSISIFSKESALCIRWPKYWSFSISPSDEYSRLIYFRIDSFDLLAVQGTLNSLSSTRFQKHQFFGTQSSVWSNSHHPCMTTGKTLGLTRRTIVSKEMSLLFNMLPRFVIAFLPRSKCVLISWLQWQTLFSWAPKSLWMVTAAMKLHCGIL